MLVTTNNTSGPPEVRSVIAIPAPLDGVTVVTTRFALSNIELPRITFHGLSVAPKLAVPLGIMLPFDFQESMPLNKKLTKPPAGCPM